MTEQELKAIGQYIETWLEDALLDTDMLSLKTETEYLKRSLNIKPGSAEEYNLCEWIRLALSEATDAYIGGAR